MTKKVYRSAMGKIVDMGALLLQNESVRAVGNMGVNARGDIIDSQNRVIDNKSQQIKRQNQRKTAINVNNLPPDYRPRNSAEPEDSFDDLPEDNDEVNVEPEVSAPAAGAGLASAIAKARTVQQETLKPQSRLQQKYGVKKI